MRIARLAVANYRSIPDFDIPLALNAVLVGPHEVGKTSILRLIDLLLGASFQQIYAEVSESDFSDPAVPVTIEVELAGLTEGDRTAFPDEVDLSGPSPSLTYRMDLQVSRESDGAVSARRWYPYSGHDRSANRDQVAAFSWYYVRADRSHNRELGAARSGALRRLLSVLELSDREGLLQALTQLRESIDRQQSVAGFKEALAEALSDALPTVVTPGDIELILRGDLEGELLGSVDVAVQRQGRRSKALLHEQSDGMLALSAMAVHTMVSGRGGIFAIDEPEMHLHPSAQRAVGRLLASSSAQTLVATHSAQIAAQSDPRDIVAFDDRGTPRALPRASRVPQPVFLDRWWRADLVDVLTSKCAAVVEGVSDRILLERAAHAHGVALDRRGVAVLDLGGAGNFEHAQSVIGSAGFALTWRGICDADYRTAWSKVLGEVDPSKLETHGITVSTTDLEDEYVRALRHRRVLVLLLVSALVSKHKILAIAGKRKLDALTRDDVLSVCRKYKTESAVAVARGASDEEIRRISSLARFLRTLPVS